MATTLTPRGKVFLGNGMVMDYGDYSSDGSTVATITVSGGYVFNISFRDANRNGIGTSTTNSVTLSAMTTTGNTTAITLTPGGSPITGGCYEIVHGGL